MKTLRDKSEKLVYESTINRMHLIVMLALGSILFFFTTNSLTIIICFGILIFVSLLFTLQYRFYNHYILKSRYILGFPIHYRKLAYLDIDKIEIKMIEAPLEPNTVAGTPLVILHQSKRRNWFMDTFSSFGFNEINDIEPLIIFLIQNYPDKVEFKISKKLYTKEYEYIQKLISSSTSKSINGGLSSKLEGSSIGN